ncbi:MerR family transcriptional regulator [Ferrimonas balearica]|uniref:MerR family transcriptional regulator n=1 Tax=Ferrimonas balearica TaxID=44012 RepID=UPI001C998955|nr:helix-turn-helix domain-containing protein [Ferrimonas balearica]MBY5922522.1 helix-turn-helix domain-containing protein [Ferrimonas balearica]MBY5995506.1 helix-turn-helix domain-containing protein [Ferrimonas balearica]
MATTYAIGKLAKLTDTKVPTIRYYEQVGLLPAPERNAGNQRRYREVHLQKLRFIRHSRQLGFGLEEIASLLALQESQADSGEVQRIARNHLDEVRDKVARLNKLEQALSQLVSCCGSGQPHDCQILSVLADHNLCQHEHEGR